MAIGNRKTIEEIQTKLVGGEPTFSNNPLSEMDLIKSLNWYSANREPKQSEKYLKDYLAKNNLNLTRVSGSDCTPTLGFLCRIKSRGAVFTDKQNAKFEQLFSVLVSDSAPVKKTKVEGVVISIQDRIEEKVNEICADLEGSIDDYIISGFSAQPSPLAIMQDRVKIGFAKKIAEVFKKKRLEFDGVMSSKDEQIKEGYSNFSRMQLKKLVAYCDLIITDVTKTTSAIEKTRKPRKRKVKTPAQLVANVKVCAKSDAFKVVSLAPEKIIGATQLWAFNTTYRKLTVFNAEDASGLTVKGSTILNFSEHNSVTKMLRKPEEVLPEVVKGGKVYLRNIMEKLTTKAAKTTGRIGKDTILLRVA